MNLTKDAYEYLLNFADDKDILNMLSTNKKFRDEEFFEKILKRRYPLLLKFKKGESYKNFFISSIFYIAKIQEKFGIPYIAEKDYDPKLIYDVIKHDKYGTERYNILMSYAAVGGDVNIVNLLLEKDKEISLDDALYHAAAGGHLNLVKFFIEKGATDLGYALFQAAEDKQLHIIKFLIEKGITKEDIRKALQVSTDENISEYLRDFL